MSERPIVMIAGRDVSQPGGGHPSYVIAHALAARAAGFSPQIFVASGSSEIMPMEYGTLHRVAARVHRGYRTEPLQREVLARAAQHYLTDLTHPGPHIVHSFGPWARTGVRAHKLLAARGIPAIPITSAYTTLAHENRAKLRALRRHHGVRQGIRYRWDYLWVRTVAGPAEVRGYSKSELVLVNYESVRRIILEACDPEPEVRIVPYAAPSAFRDPGAHEAGDPDVPLIVTVSRHDPRKGLDVLIHALAGLARAQVPFRVVMVGMGRLTDAHRRLVADLGLSDRVEIVGLVDDVFTYLNRADVFVLPSLEEGSGSVALLEALQAGAAVVASGCDGIPEDLADGTDALLVEPGNVQDLERALSSVLTDAQLRGRLAARARAVFEERFSGEHFSGALGGLYEELLSA
jgi:glycosyltransferase involved in cell wall biosynthesis